MINSKQIEDLSVGAVSKSISLTSYLSPFIQSDDKEPSWDGFVYIYTDKSIRKDTLKGRVPVQVKGKVCSDFTKNKIKYSVEVVDLKNYLEDGGVMFYVVYLNNNLDSDKIYYSALTPVRLHGYLKNIGDQKYKTIELKEFPSDKNKIRSVFHNFQDDRRKQSSFTQTGLISFEDLNQMNVQQLTFSLTDYSYNNKKNKLIEPLLESDEIYLYAKLEGSDALHPIDTIISSISIPEKVNQSITVNDKMFYTSFSRELSKEKTIIKIGESLFIIITGKDQPVKLNFKSAKMLRSRVLDFEFIIDAIKAKHFSINGKKIFFEIPDKELEKFNITKQLESVKLYKNILQLFTILNVDDDINIEELTTNDYNSLDVLIKAFVKKELVNNLKEGMDVERLKISNLRLLLFFIKSKDSTTTYEIRDFFDSKRMFAYEDENGNMLRVPAYSYLNKKDYIEISNINYNAISPSYKELSKLNDRLFEMANNDMLQMLSAYDESKQKKSILLKVAKEIALWILKEDNDNLPKEMRILNYLQIVKRERELNKDERKELIQMSQNKSTSNDMNAAIYLLLENNEFVDFYLNKMSEKEKIEFKKYPIFIFYELDK